MDGKPIYLIATPFYPALDDWRGSFVEDFAHAVARSGDWRVIVLRLDFSMRTWKTESQGVQILSLPFMRLPGMCFPMAFANENIRYFNMVLKENGIDKKEIAVLHAHTALCTIYADAVDCVSFEHHHDCDSYGTHLGWLRWSRLYRLWEKRILCRWHERITQHVFISEIVRRNFEAQLGRGVDAYLLYNGVDKRIFPRRENKPLGVHLIIGCVGNFEDGKDQEILIRALAGVNDVEVHFIGTGPTRRMCERLSFELGVDCKWEPERRHEAMGEWYRSLDLFVLPSSYEGMGCVFLEAASSGVPFICSDKAGVAELIKGNRDSWVFKAQNVGDLRNKILGWRENRSVQDLEEYDIDVLVGRFNSWVKEIVLS